jgi:hypothetical protein
MWKKGLFIKAIYSHTRAQRGFVCHHFLHQSAIHFKKDGLLLLLLLIVLLACVAARCASLFYKLE